MIRKSLLSGSPCRCEYSLYSFSCCQCLGKYRFYYLYLCFQQVGHKSWELLSVSVSGYWTFLSNRISEHSSLLSDPHECYPRLALLRPLFQLSYPKAEVVRCFSCWSLQYSLRNTFYWDHLSPATAAVHTFRSDSCLAAMVFAILHWIQRFSVQKLLCSAKFILSVTGNRAYSEFLFHPCVYSCKFTGLQQAVPQCQLRRAGLPE